MLIGSLKPSLYPSLDGALRPQPDFLSPDSQGRPFTPAALAGLHLWYDAADASTFTLTGALVDQWRDKSGTGSNKTLAPNPNKPTRQLDGARMGVLSNTVGSNQLQASVISPTFGSTVGYTAFIAVRSLAAPVNNTFFRFQAGGSINNGVGYPVAFNNTTQDIGFPAIATAATTQTNANIYCIRQDDTTTGIKRQGAAEVTGASTATLNGIDKVYIGSAQLSGVVCWDGYIYEFVCYSRVLTTAERAQVEAYLMAKWSIT